MSFEYCTVAEAFAYGNSAGTATDPVNEASVMAGLLPAVARAIDRYTGLTFCQATYTDQVVRAVVDQDGVLTAALGVNTMRAPTALAYRTGNTLTWQSLNGNAADITTQPYGCTLRVLGVDATAARFGRVQLQLSYVGGFADLATLAAAYPDLCWAARAVAWFEYQRRTAPSDRTAIPELGVVIVPGQWPANIRQTLTTFRRGVAI